MLIIEHSVSAKQGLLLHSIWLGNQEVGIGSQ